MIDADREDAGLLLAKLLGLVADRNPFQRARLHGAGSTTPLRDLPILTKSELIADQSLNRPFGSNLTFPLNRYTHFHQTSGTMGTPLRVLDTAEDWEWWCNGLARVFVEAGIRAGDRVAFAFSFGPHVQFWAAKEGLERLGAMSVPLGGMTSEQRLRTIAAIQASAIMCTPTYALRLVEVALEHHLEGALEPIRRIICTGESGASLPAVRARIEEGFRARCFDHAGLTEVGPFGYPCSEGGGLHVDESDFLCEVLDERLEPSGEGERGELVLTPLRRFGFPVLRYRTGDVVVNTHGRCPAAHHSRWMPGGIVGRTDDMVVIRGMNVYPSAIEEAVRQVSASGEFRITFYSERHGMDEIKLEVEMSESESVRRLQEIIRQQLGLRVRVVPVAPGMLPRTMGKARRVVDQRPDRWMRS